MAKYIPLDALVAEIERQIELLKPYLGACAGQIVAEANAKLSVLEGLKDFLDTIEAKDVGLPNFEQEVKDFCYGFDDRKEAWYKMTPRDQNLMVSPTFANFAMQLAKHFFELGLSASNPNDSVIKEERKEIWWF